MFTSFCLLPSTNWSFFLQLLAHTSQCVVQKLFCCLLSACPLTAVLVINNNWFLLSFHFKVLIAKSWWQPNEGWHKHLLQGGCLLTPLSSCCCSKHTCVYHLACCMHPFSICNWTNWNCWQLYHDLKTFLEFPCTLSSQVNASWGQSVHHHDDGLPRALRQK